MLQDLVITSLGGLGLILLGMKLMTDGLKLAGGSVLRRTLKRFTNRPLKALITGICVTGAVQSSSAVTVAAIGFVNAGLISFSQVVWVIYGSNVGTTVTGWIVALIGLNIKIKALALPFIAMGTGLWIFSRTGRRGATGEALAGFGLFFLGVEMLKTAFNTVGATAAFPTLAGYAATPFLGPMLFALIGFVFTFLMQSSSAAMALIITAAASGLIPLTAAASAVIGANLGTTSTAVLAVIGATANAKRTAGIHIAFNAVTGPAAFLLMPLLLSGIQALRMRLGLSADTASVLALFHTIFNILGILLLWPLTPHLVRFFQNKFVTPDVGGGTKYLDDTVLKTPSLALNAGIMEVLRIAETARRIAYSSLLGPGESCSELKDEQDDVAGLLQETAKFAARLRQEGLPKDIAETLPWLLRSGRYYASVVDTAKKIYAEKLEPEAIPPMGIAELEADLNDAAVTCVVSSDPEHPSFSPIRLQHLMNDFEIRYQELKRELLEAGTAGRLDAEAMVRRLDRYSMVRRMLDQNQKGAKLLFRLGHQSVLYSDTENTYMEYDQGKFIESADSYSDPD